MDNQKDLLEEKDVEKEVKVEEKVEDVKKEETKKTKKDNNSKKSKKGLIIALVIILALAIAGGVAAGVYFLNKDDSSSKKKNLKWGEVYLEILEDKDKKLEDLENQEIQLVDIDKDSIPELIIYGFNSLKERIANIYKINDKDKVDTVKVGLNEDFDIRLLYTFENDDYNWYAVTNKAETAETPTPRKVYDLNIVSKKYEPELLNINFDTDTFEVEEGYSKKVAFDKNASKEEKKRVLDDATENYVETEEMITEEVKSKVETKKMFRNIKKLDNTKEIVYTGLSYKDTYKSLEYPVINIDSTDVAAMNKEIYSKYGFSQEEVRKEKNGTSYEPLGGLETEEISYEYSVYNKYLSVSCKIGGNSSVWGTTYNVDLTTLNKMSQDEVLAVGNISKDSAISKAKELAGKAFSETIDRDKKAWGNHWNDNYGSNYETQWKNELNTAIEKLERLYIDKDGSIILFVGFSHPGGQWSCTKCLKINLSKNTCEEYKLNNGMSSDEDWGPMLSAMNETATSPSTAPTPSVKPSASNSTSTGPTNPAITKEQALALAQKHYGTKDPDMGYEIGYSYAGWGKYNGKEYYVFIMRWYVEDHWSYINTACISTDGKTWASIASNNSDFKGETLDIEPEYTGSL